MTIIQGKQVFIVFELGISLNEQWIWLSLDFLKVLYLFFLIAYAILKDFLYLFGMSFTNWKSYRWVVMIDQ